MGVMMEILQKNKEDLRCGFFKSRKWAAQTTSQLALLVETPSAKPLQTQL